MTPHPHHHVAHHRHGDEGDHRLEAFLLAIGQVLRRHVEGDANAEAQHDGGRDARPHPSEQVEPSVGAQERGDDADDQGRLEPLAKPDHERRQHGRRL